MPEQHTTNEAAAETVSNSETLVEVTRDELPMHCPAPSAPLWNVIVKHQCDREERITYCYRPDATPVFDRTVFDQEKLKALGQLSGIAQGGRGNTFFIEHGDASLVLRHYRRGGMVRYISDASYFYTGLERTRAHREFLCLCELEDLELPAARPYACRVERRGLIYSASLVTYLLPGTTLATRLIDGKLTPELWRAVGECIARFHACGICHADLNTHNILIDDAGNVSLIDFDRARRYSAESLPVIPPWAQRNIDRLWRSVCKFAGGDESHTVGFTELRNAWQESLN